MHIAGQLRPQAAPEAAPGAMTTPSARQRRQDDVHKLLTNDAVRAALLKVLEELPLEIDDDARGALHELMRNDAARNVHARCSMMTIGR
jgi:hypothetical protein